MGICFSFSKRRKTKLLLLNQKALELNPVVLIEENFKILDHTGELKDIYDISLTKSTFSDYQVTDLRCVKGSRESKHDHSHLIATFGRLSLGSIIDELGLIVSYSPYGFAVSIGDLELITKDSGLLRANIEFLHLPRADSEKRISIPDILEWTYLHKDERYMDPFKVKEFNMGSRIYFHFVSLLSDR